MTYFKLKMVFSGVLIILFAAVMTASVQASEEKTTAEENSNPDIYIKVPPFAVSMYHRGYPKGNITIIIVLKVEDKKKRDQAREYLPRLSSAYVIEASRLSYDFFDVARPVNVTLLRQGLQQTTNKLLGHKDAQVLMSNVVVNK